MKPASARGAVVLGQLALAPADGFADVVTRRDQGGVPPEVAER
jgi:hypothetical protein